MTPQARVLVVDQFDDTTEVLRAVLEPRGVSVQRLARFEVAPVSPIGPGPDGKRSRLSLVVVDGETATAHGFSVMAFQGVPKVIIGTAALPRHASEPADGAQRRYLCKPFQYTELLQAIESLIGIRSGKPPAASEAARAGLQRPS